MAEGVVVVGGSLALALHASQPGSVAPGGRVTATVFVSIPVTPATEFVRELRAVIERGGGAQ